jgi:NitT/TauT family transport system permease protein
MKTVWKPIALLVGLVLLTEALVIVLNVPAYLIPAPSAVVVEMVTDWDYYWSAVPPTLIEIVVGFILAVIVGVVLAIPVALTRFGEQALMPLVVATQSIPKAALAPIFVVWFGFDLMPKIVVAMLLAFFPIVVNMARGLRAVEPELVQYMSTLGASSWFVFVRLRLPQSAPYLFAAMKVGVSLATVGAIVGEFIGADRGLGYLMTNAMNNFDTTSMFSALVLTSAIGVVLYGLVAFAERRFMSWQPDAAIAASA